MIRINSNFQSLFRLISLSFLFLHIGEVRSIAQTLRQRLSLQMETSFNRGQNVYLPASLSLGSEVRCWLANKFYAGIRLDIGVESFGNNSYSMSNAVGTAQYSYSEYGLSTMSSLSLKGYYEFRLLKSRLFIGYGLGRFFGSGLIWYKTLPVGSPTTYINNYRLKPAWLVCRSIGIRGEKINFSITSNLSSKVGRYGKNRSVVNHFAYSLGFEFGSGKTLSKFKGKALYQLPLIMLDAGNEVLLPFGGKSGGATSNAVFIEPKIAINEHSSFGIGLKSLGGSYGRDGNGWPFDTIYVKDGFPTIPEEVPPFSGRNENEISLVKSIYLMYDHYFMRKNGWLYIGGGVGRYRSIGREAIIETDDFGGSIVTPGIPKETAIGGLIRLGYKTGSFRTGLNVNFVTKQIPFHIGFHMGIEPGFFKGNLKSRLVKS